MKQKNEDSNVPLVGQVAKHYQEDGKTVVECVLEEVSLWSDEDMPESTTEVFSELANVEHFHLKCGLGDSRSGNAHSVWISISS